MYTFNLTENELHKLRERCKDHAGPLGFLHPSLTLEHALQGWHPATWLGFEGCHAVVADRPGDHRALPAQSEPVCPLLLTTKQTPHTSPRPSGRLAARTPSGSPGTERQPPAPHSACSEFTLSGLRRDSSQGDPGQRTLVRPSLTRAPWEPQTRSRRFLPGPRASDFEETLSPRSPKHWVPSEGHPGELGIQAAGQIQRPAAKSSVQTPKRRWGRNLSTEAVVLPPRGRTLLGGARRRRKPMAKACSAGSCWCIGEDARPLGPRGGR